MERLILAIDPGNEESAYVLLDGDLRPLSMAKAANELVYCHIVAAMAAHFEPEIHIAIEMIASYGMPVGIEVFDTCVWIGVLKERFRRAGYDVQYIHRKEEKMALCGSMRATDANITQALVDRFAPGQPNHGKGTKKAPGWFYGFKKDIWQAYAVGVTFHDIYLKGE